MRKNIILIISLVISVVLFILLTILQSKIIKGEEMAKVYVAISDIERDCEIKEGNYKEANIPISLVNNNMVKTSQELANKYSRDRINKGQIIFKQDIAKKEELKIVEAEKGLERISIKIKSPENSVSYQIKPKDRIHLYFTGRTNVIKEPFIKNRISFNNELGDNSYQTQKIINDTEILGIYDELGKPYENSDFGKIDSIVIATKPEIANMINNLRSQGTFDITR